MFEQLSLKIEQRAKGSASLQACPLGRANRKGVEGVKGSGLLAFPHSLDGATRVNLN